MFQSEYGVLGLIFDTLDGPKIVETDGQLKFSDQELQSIKSCAFPDSLIQNQKEHLLFVYKVSNYFCHCIFSTRPDSTAPRGHIQISYVVATSLPYIYPFTRLLESSLQIISLPIHEVIGCLVNFLKKWSALSRELDLISEDPHDLPMFDGSLVLRIPNDDQMLLINGGIGWNPLCSIYYLNNYFLDFDLSETLSFKNFCSLHYSQYFLRLWEISILEESLLVVAPSPQSSSSAVLSIASMSFYNSNQSTPTNIQPFVAVSDKRFQTLASNPNKTIIGVSNPIAMRYASNFDEVFNLTLSFDAPGQKNEKSPLLHTYGRFKLIESFSSTELRHFAFENTQKVANAIENSLNHLRGCNPYAHLMGQMPTNILVDSLQASNAYFTSNINEFAQKLLRSSFYVNIWRKSRMIEAFQDAVQNFEVGKICVGRSEHELVDLYSLIEEVRKMFKGPPFLIKKIKEDLETVAIYLSPDLKLAPSN